MECQLRSRSVVAAPFMTQMSDLTFSLRKPSRVQREIRHLKKIDHHSNEKYIVRLAKLTLI